MENKEQNQKEQGRIDPAIERKLNNIEPGDDALIFIITAFLLLLVIIYKLVFGA